MTNNISNNGNGNGKTKLESMPELVTDTKIVDTSADKALKTKNKKPRKPSQNTIQYANIVLDAGSKNVKVMINGFESVIESKFKIVKADLPAGRAGCFSYGNKNYYVGAGCESVLGETVNAHENNKIKELAIWLIGALTSDPDYLDELIADKGKKKGAANRYGSQPIRIHINLKLLSLSSSKKGDITKILNSIGNFWYRNKEFELKIVNLEDEFLYPEGYGAALTAVSEVPNDMKSFYILDLGFGTLTLTEYKKARRRPKANKPQVASGGGMHIILKRIYSSFSKVDAGGQEKQLPSILAALKACKRTDEAYSTPYRLGNQNIDISESVIDALSNWLAQNPTIEEVLTATSEALNNGEYVFATGGGFAAVIISDWIEKWVSNDIYEPNFKVLDNPQVINVTGMKLLAE